MLARLCGARFRYFPHDLFQTWSESRYPVLRLYLCCGTSKEELWTLPFPLCLWRNIRAWAGEGTGTPLFGLYRYVQPQRVGCLSCFGLIKVIDLDHSEIGYVFLTIWALAIFRSSIIFARFCGDFSKFQTFPLHPFKRDRKVDTLSAST